MNLLLKKELVKEIVTTASSEEAIEAIFLSDRHFFNVWKVVTKSRAFLFRISEDHARIVSNFSILQELKELKIAPLPLYQGESNPFIWTIEEWVEGEAGLTKRIKGGISPKEVEEIVGRLEKMHGKLPASPTNVKESIFHRYNLFFGDAKKNGFLSEVQWLEENFPKETTPSRIHGSLNLSNTVWKRERVFFIDFSDSFTAEKEMDLGSLYVNEFFPFEWLVKALSSSNYDIKKVLYYAILYAVKHLGKGGRDALILGRLAELKGRFLKF